MEYELYSNESGQWRLISPYKTNIFKSADEYYLSNGLLDSAHYWNITYAPEEMHEYSKYKYFGDTMCAIVLKNLKNTWLDTIKIRKDNTTLTTSYQIIGKDTILTNREIRTYKNCIAIHAFTESYKLMDGVPTLYSTDTFNQKQIADINNAQRNKNNEITTSYDPKGNILQSYSVSENEKKGDSTKILNTHLYQYY